MNVDMNAFSNNETSIRKKEIRHDLISIRLSIKEDERSAHDAAILNNLVNTEEYRQSDTVLTYASYNGEAGTYDFIKRCIKDGKQVACPLSGYINGEPKLDFYYISDSDSLREGFKGIPEPVPEISYKVDDDMILQALIVVPMVGYDKTGNRLGYGGGFYDRFLAFHRYRAAIGLAYSCQEYNSLPVDKYDCKPDMIINENEVIRIKDHT